MAKQVINIGRSVNDKTGDPIRTAFGKVNDNFTELYNLVGSSGTSYTLPVATTLVLGGVKIDGTSITINPEGIISTSGGTGMKGDKGDTGATGPQGPQGIQGLQGLAGATGAQGVQGAQGPEGPQGVAGLQGPTGPQGDTGPQGVAGAKGDQGITGAQGDAGPKGDTGAQGISVTLQGTKATIADLPAAPVDWNTFAGHGWIVTAGDGITHANGSLWFWNLTTGQWNDIGPIVGPQGNVGATGPRGLQGPQGNDGLQGIQGPAGAAGAQGPEGAQGPRGLTGPQGDTGPTGPTGATGPAGGNADTGNIGFVTDFIYDLNGVTIENADLSHGATSAVVVPGNGTADALQINNLYGPVSITSGATNVTKSWTFDNLGNLVPGTDNIQDIGTPTNRVRHIYVGPGSISVGSSIITESTTGKLVLPGLTRGTGYTVEEVDDHGNQTQQFNNANPVALDAALYAAVVAQSDTSYFADYTVNLDDEGYIDNIQVNGAGTYSEAESVVARNNDMYVYAGAGSASDRPLVPQDWIQVPFRPRMKAGDTEYEFSTGGGGNPLTVYNVNNANTWLNVTELQFGDNLVVTDVGQEGQGILRIDATGGGSSGVVQRSVNFPAGTEGDTRGTLALDPDNTLYLSTHNYGAGQPLTSNVFTPEDYSTGQSYNQSVIFGLATSAFPDIAALVNTNMPGEWQVTVDAEGLSGTFTVTEINSVTFSSGDYEGQQGYWFNIGPQGDSFAFPADTEYTLIYTANSPTNIWEMIPAINGDGNLVIDGNVVIGGAGTNNETHLVIDGANYWTSIQWKNFPTQPTTAAPFECQSQLLRVFRGDNTINGHEELVAVTANTDNGDENCLMITTSKGKIPDAPYNDGVGIQYNWIFGGDGKVQFPDGTKQTTAYVQQAINLDGGGAGVKYDAQYAYVDGGFSSTRFGTLSTVYDGGNTLTESNQTTLDGGGA
jgi:hypothetical protein